MTSIVKRLWANSSLSKWREVALNLVHQAAFDVTARAWCGRATLDICVWTNRLSRCYKRRELASRRTLSRLIRSHPCFSASAPLLSWSTTQIYRTTWSIHWRSATQHRTPWGHTRARKSSDVTARPSAATTSTKKPKIWPVWRLLRIRETLIRSWSRTSRSISSSICMTERAKQRYLTAKRRQLAPCSRSSQSCIRSSATCRTRRRNKIWSLMASAGASIGTLVTLSNYSPASFSSLNDITSSHRFSTAFASSASDSYRTGETIWLVMRPSTQYSSSSEFIWL